MNETILYLLKVSAGLGIIFIPYYFLIRNDPDLLLKRFYLLAGLLAAWIFPLITFRKPELFSGLNPTVFMDPSTPSSVPDLTGSRPTGLQGVDATARLSINWVQLLAVIYLAGLLLLLARNIWLLLKWNRTWKRSKNGDGTALANNDQVFSLFTRIFIPASLRDHADFETVLLHERAHIRQLHFIDLMLMEFTLLLTWFNPFSWLISRMIKENHEHLADRQVLSAGVNPARYRAQLLNLTLGVPVFRLGNQFNHSLTFKRFNMMKKPKSSLKGIVKIALLIPAVLLILGLATGMSPQEKGIKGKVIFSGTDEPAPGASVVIAGTTMGTVTGTDGTFRLNVEGDPEIVISFVGFQTLKLRASEIGRKPLALEPKVYTLDLEDLPVQESKKSAESIKIPEEKHTEKEIFFLVEDMPSFPGGNAALKDYIYSNLEYPENARSGGITGEVLVQFLVTASGKLQDIRVARSSYAGFDRPALEVFEGMPDWKPGRQRGKPVAVNVIVPVRFNPGTE
ncbi:MAG TPA: TonB family protein [Bacteroides sp.]|nr:TonB family protein [Bacteroides sp.]